MLSVLTIINSKKRRRPVWGGRGLGHVCCWPVFSPASTLSSREACPKSWKESHFLSLPFHPTLPQILLCPLMNADTEICLNPPACRSTQIKTSLALPSTLVPSQSQGANFERNLLFSSSASWGNTLKSRNQVSIQARMNEMIGST